MGKKSEKEKTKKEALRIKEAAEKYAKSEKALRKIRGKIRKSIPASKIDLEKMTRRYKELREKNLATKKAMQNYPQILTQKPGTIEKHMKELEKKGISKKAIKNHPQLLARDPKIIEEHMKRLKELGISKKAMRSQPNILEIRPGTVEEHMKKLKELGINKKAIKNNPQILAKDPKAVKEHMKKLKELGINKKAIRSRPQILGRNPGTVEEHMKRLKELGINKKIIRSQPNILEFRPGTVEEHMKKLKELGINKKAIKNNPQILISNPKTIEDKIKSLEELGAGEVAKKNPVVLYGKYETVKHNLKTLREKNIKLKKIDTSTLILKPERLRDRLNMLEKELKSPKEIEKIRRGLSNSTYKLRAKLDYLKKHDQKLKGYRLRDSLRKLIERTEEVSETKAAEKEQEIYNKYGKLANVEPPVNTKHEPSKRRMFRKEGEKYPEEVEPLTSKEEKAEVFEEQKENIEEALNKSKNELAEYLKEEMGIPIEPGETQVYRKMLKKEKERLENKEQLKKEEKET